MNLKGLFTVYCIPDDYIMHTATSVPLQTSIPIFSEGTLISNQLTLKEQQKILKREKEERERMIKNQRLEKEKEEKDTIRVTIIIFVVLAIIAAVVAAVTLSQKAEGLKPPAKQPEKETPKLNNVNQTKGDPAAAANNTVRPDVTDPKYQNKNPATVNVSLGTPISSSSGSSAMVPGAVILPGMLPNNGSNATANYNTTLAQAAAHMIDANGKAISMVNNNGDLMFKNPDGTLTNTLPIGASYVDANGVKQLIDTNLGRQLQNIADLTPVAQITQDNYGNWNNVTLPTSQIIIQDVNGITTTLANSAILPRADQIMNVAFAANTTAANSYITSGNVPWITADGGNTLLAARNNFSNFQTTTPYNQYRQDFDTYSNSVLKNLNNGMNIDFNTAATSYSSIPSTGKGLNTANSIIYDASKNIKDVTPSVYASYTSSLIQAQGSENGLSNMRNLYQQFGIAGHTTNSVDAIVNALSNGGNTTGFTNNGNGTFTISNSFGNGVPAGTYDAQSLANYCQTQQQTFANNYITNSTIPASGVASGYASFNFDTSNPPVSANAVSTFVNSLANISSSHQAANLQIASMPANQVSNINNQLGLSNQNLQTGLLGAQLLPNGSVDPNTMINIDKCFSGIGNLFNSTSPMAVSSNLSAINANIAHNNALNTYERGYLPFDFNSFGIRSYNSQNLYGNSTSGINSKVSYYGNGVSP